MQNVGQTVLSQYANSPIILAIINQANEALDPAANITAFYNSVWNINTATGYGLDVWGRIVGISRYVQLKSQADVFGFQTGGTPEHSLPFGDGVFSAGSTSTDTYRLTDSIYRSLILFKAFTNIAATNIPTLNQIAQRLAAIMRDFSIASGYTTTGDPSKVYVQDLGGMTMSYVFAYTLNEYEQAIVNIPGILPHPSGVSVTIA